MILKTTGADSKTTEEMPVDAGETTHGARASNTEATFNFEDLFFSSTNLKGIITAGNRVFYRIAEYSEAEALGRPHNIIRHPDMPKAVFKLLWDYLHAGKDIVAYVVNKSKSGKFYWVLALVSPVKDASGEVTEYMSVRIKPSSPVLDQVKGLYKAMLAAEETGGMEAGGQCLDEALEGLGLKNYDEFMSVVLRAELEHYLDNGIFDTIGNVNEMGDNHTQNHLRKIFSKIIAGQEASLDKFANVFTAFETLDSLFTSTRYFFDSIKDSSMNIAISASKLDGNASSALSPIAFELINLSCLAARTVEDFHSVVTGTKAASDHLDLNLRRSLVFSALIKGQLSDDDCGEGDISTFLHAASKISEKSLLEIDEGLRELRSARGELQDFISRKLGGFLASGSSLCIQGIIQANVWNATHMVNTLTELQELTGKLETEIDEASRLFVQIDEVLDYIARVVFQVQTASEKLDELEHTLV
ncbi:MAG: PAS domain-containing protein [Leptospirillia bacterium]